MKKLDTNNDGIISVEEWEQAIKSIQAEMVEQVGHRHLPGRRRQKGCGSDDKDAKVKK